MSDLFIGLVAVAVVSAGMFLLALRLGGGQNHHRNAYLGLITLVAILFYTWHLWDHVLLARLLPWSNLIVVGNWYPPAAAFLAGLAWDGVPGGVLRRSISVIALVGVSAYSTVCPLLGEVPRCADAWNEDGICLQTTRATCSAACAATLLNLYGIAATEQEMAELCLTRRGTRWQGLYHGLKRKTAGTRWDVEVLDCHSSQLPSRISEPVIAAVGLDTKSERARTWYRTEYGLVPGFQHSVIIERFGRDGCVKVIDPHPDYGQEIWDPEMLADLWKGPVLRLVSRSDVDVVEERFLTSMR